MGARILPPLEEDMYKGFWMISVCMREANKLVLNKTNLGVDCAFPDCHAIVRAVHRFVSGAFDVVDGCVPVLKELVVQGEPHIMPVPMYHSWLALKREQRCIIDVVPLGTMPMFPSPAFLYLDEYAPEYVVGALSSGVSLEQVERNAEHMGRLLAEVLRDKLQEKQKAA